ncbi:PAN domain-containing protein [Brucella intermedia]|uniref:PAN domain-containing protein n=1 Tax=Brucella intermedia TaxID=94625 RepID=UPI00224A7AEA|nr:PAN domain-containing protein [Brucella intermedia]
MRKSFCYAFAGIFWLYSAVTSTTVLAAENTFGPFSVDDAKPDIIAMNGLVEQGTALDFRRALRAAPDAKLITLNSGGGNVQAGLLIADDINQRGLTTYIPKTSKCFSACSYIFLAGKERKADGELGVHQISSDSPDLIGAQLAISDIIEVLSRFDTPPEVMQIMFKTPPDDMYVFSQEEIKRFKLNRSGEEQTVVNSPAASIVSTEKDDDVLETGKPVTSVSTIVPAHEPTVKTESVAKLSPLEEFTKRPNRIALYTGLDLFGEDISTIRVNDAAACAKSCLAMNGQCKAFTFNTNPRIKKGPNCFLKASEGRADGNSVAFSGRFLSGAESDPEPFSLGMIDPAKALFEDIDLPGGDLSRRPHTSAKNPLACRLACIDNSQCVAFTYIKPKKECWLKGSVGAPTFGKGLVTGVKKYETFAPAKVITLN